MVDDRDTFNMKPFQDIRASLKLVMSRYNSSNIPKFLSSSEAIVMFYCRTL